ncbi:MAG: DUF4143 domain-containing protein [Bacteroidetes bacterium]|nr:DUF4143 domain-containing protein [Bacteroidota bacterium]
MLDNLTSKYLFKDIFAFEQLKKPAFLIRLLQMLAFQVGQEVSVNELAVSLGVARKTIEHYIDLLEKAFVVFRLGGFSRNLRQEINRKFKVYFYDNGIRNSVIGLFNSLELRNDTGQLWENFCITERKKYLQKNKIIARQFFWRTHQQQEIDYLEEIDGKIVAYEFKYSARKTKIPALFLQTYQGSEFRLINRANFMEFID